MKGNKQLTAVFTVSIRQIEVPPRSFGCVCANCSSPFLFVFLFLSSLTHEGCTSTRCATLKVPSTFYASKSATVMLFGSKLRFLCEGGANTSWTLKVNLRRRICCWWKFLLSIWAYCVLMSVDSRKTVKFLINRIIDVNLKRQIQATTSEEEHKNMIHFASLIKGDDFIVHGKY